MHIVQAIVCNVHSFKSICRTIYTKTAYCLVTRQANKKAGTEVQKVQRTANNKNTNWNDRITISELKWCNKSERTRTNHGTAQLFLVVWWHCVSECATIASHYFKFKSALCKLIYVLIVFMCRFYQLFYRMSSDGNFSSFHRTTANSTHLTS